MQDFAGGVRIFCGAGNNVSVQGEPDERKAGRLVHCGLYCLVLENSWKGASARAKGTSATL
jgi:hypothetical protein